MFDESVLGDAGDGYRFRVVHHPEREVENVDADVDAGAAAAVFVVQEAGAERDGVAAQVPAAGMVNFTEPVHFLFECDVGAGEALVLGGH